ncbi:MAG: metal-sensitive transcriptional regulator [Thermomicrobiales bacterium]
MTATDTTDARLASLQAPIDGPETDLLAGRQTAPPTRRTTSYQDDKDKILTRLRRIEGQVRGVQRMIEGDQYCIDVMTQLSSIIAATRATGLLVLEDHIRGCVIGAAEDEREAVLAELTNAIDRFNRTIG